MHYFEALISLHGEMALEENMEKISFTKSMNVFYEHNDKCDVVGTIFEVEVDSIIKVCGYFNKDKLGDKLANKVRSKNNPLKPIFTGVVLSQNDSISRIVIDGFSLSELDGDIGSTITMVDRVIN